MTDNEAWRRFAEGLVYKDELQKLVALRERLFECILKANELSDGYHKPYEGRLDLEFSLPNIWEDEDIAPEWTLHLACYLLSDEGRGKDWRGESINDVLDQFEKWLDGLPEYLYQWEQNIKSEL